MNMNRTRIINPLSFGLAILAAAVAASAAEDNSQSQAPDRR